MKHTQTTTALAALMAVCMLIGCNKVETSAPHSANTQTSTPSSEKTAVANTDRRSPSAAQTTNSSQAELLANRPSITGINYEHHDWMIVCDNTGTCRMAGYQVDGDDRPASILLTREAGADTPVTGLIRLETPESEVPPTAELIINGQSLGSLSTSDKDHAFVLTPKQVQAIVVGLRGNINIKLSHGSNQWHISDKGATAVMLKADEYQQRLDTPSALVRKGNRSQDDVLATIAMPSLRIPDDAKVPATKADDAATFAKLAQSLTTSIASSLATINESEEYCDIELLEDTEGWRVERLDNHHLLASHPCWRAAYNEGLGVWVLDERANYQPTLVTTDASDIDKGQIFANHRGRGIGDCWSLSTWSWDGAAFVPTLRANTGLCRGFAGGAWTLPMHNIQVD